jgi:deoxyadenosine/deoxycytidine kinase
MEVIGKIDFAMITEKRKNVKLIFIEGNIGSGKSTLVKRLRENPHLLNMDCDFVLEPVDEWKETKLNDGVDMLDAYYQDQKAKAAGFQMYALFTRINRIISCIKNTNKKYIIVERSPFSDKKCFLKVNQSKGYIDEFHTIVYNQLFGFFRDNTNLITADKVIYLQLNPEECMNRIKLRMQKEHREGEKLIQFDYLQTLHDLHEKWLVSKLNTSDANVNNVITVYDSNRNFEGDDIVLNEIADIIKNMM